MSVNVLDLWDFGNPALSEERFCAAMEGASPDDSLILQTQIARCFGIRKDFLKAREILSAIDETKSENPEIRARYWLELGRSLSSITHPPESQTEDTRKEAMHAYLRAFDIASKSRLDYLAVDALHMKAIAEPERELFWTSCALTYLENSSQEEAKKWEGSIRNNLGYALHQSGEIEKALVQFQAALAIREKSGNLVQVRVGKWMVAWTLRTLERFDDALMMQLDLEKEWEEVGKPSPYVFEELEHLYRAKGDAERVAHYAIKRNEPAT